MKMLERHYDELMKHIPAGTEVPAIEITNAAKWFYEESDKEYWDFSTDFPAVVPPYPITWLEFIPPKSTGVHYLESIGCMAFVATVTDKNGQSVIKNDILKAVIENAARKTGTRFTASDDKEHERRINSALQSGYTAKWIAIYKLYFEHKKHITWFYTFGTYLDRDGKIIPELHQFALDTALMKMMGDQALHIGSETFPFLFALSLMHAKNVSLEDMPLPAPAIAKKRERQGKRTLQFKTIHIHPMRQAAKAQSSQSQSSTKLAMHFCRGHFKDFREGQGLFGKYKGLYWWDMHVRGNESNGKVIKDYEVVP